MRKLLSRLYNGTSTRSKLFRFIILFIDIAAIIFFIATAMMPYRSWIEQIDLAIAAFFALDLLARFWIVPIKWKFMLRPATIIDIVIIVALIAPLFFSNLLFLRVFRTLRLLGSHHVVRDLREYSDFFVHHEKVIYAAINLFVFVFFMSSLVFVLQHDVNEQINNYIDALYYTVTTLTTTGFGDITLHGNTGKLLSIFIMVFGISLFLNLIQTLFRPRNNKVDVTCTNCGLSRHEPDAVCCKHCGKGINIPNIGEMIP